MADIQEKNEVQLGLESAVADIRGAILQVEGLVIGLKKHPLLTGPETYPGVDKGEAIANIMLAYRAAEDARMRLGKVFQALNGGVSNNTR